MAIEQGAKDASPYINRAAVYMAQKKYDLAVKDYTKAATIDPQNPGICQQRAVAWKLAGRFDKAVEDFGKAIELDPKNVGAWMGRGFVWFQEREYQKAIDDFSKAIELAPNLAQAHNNRGYNRQMLDDYENALADYNQAIRLAPEYALAYQNKAWLLASCDDPKIRNAKEAVEAATTACKLTDYKDLGAVKALAAAFAEAGEFDKAIGWQEKVVQGVLEEDEEEQAIERETLEKYKANRPFRLSEARDDEK
jgi:tetratricopeptide (TPR) repeat protein